MFASSASSHAGLLVYVYLRDVAGVAGRGVAMNLVVSPPLSWLLNHVDASPRLWEIVFSCWRVEMPFSREARRSVECGTLRNTRCE